MSPKCANLLTEQPLGGASNKGRQGVQETSTVGPLRSEELPCARKLPPLHNFLVFSLSVCCDLRFPRPSCPHRMNGNSGKEGFIESVKSYPSLLAGHSRNKETAISSCKGSGLQQKYIKLWGGVIFMPPIQHNILGNKSDSCLHRLAA